jgi:poly(A) polymerase
LRIDKFHQGRKCQVDFTDQYYHDAIRRDFTINSLYLDFQGIIYDYCNGIDDIKNKIVRFIGNPDQRINEDYLRILRFFRFSIVVIVK